jgi:Flp pilus assembly protein TadD
MLYANLAALQIQEGHLDEAERACEKALQVQPRALAPLHTLVYILLRRGQHAQALERLKQSRMPDSRVC